MKKISIDKRMNRVCLHQLSYRVTIKLGDSELIIQNIFSEKADSVLINKRGFKR